jgi:3-hydroxybutyrate dehydrogenase
MLNGETHMLKGKTAIVTGSTSGIGEQIANALAREGANIMLNGFGDAAAIEKQRAQLASKYSVKVAYSPADMTKPADIYKMVEDTVSQLGRVDILVNNAGVQTVSPIENFPDDKFEAIIKINLMSAWYASKAVFKAMKDAKWGRIINIASAHALVASPDKSAYVMAKHGLLGLTRTLALEGAEQGITVNAICPGYVKTPLVDKQIPETAKARGMTEEQVIHDVILAAQPTKRFVTTDEIAGIAVFLCSPSAISINGAPISVDGGWTAA